MRGELPSFQISKWAIWLSLMLPAESPAAVSHECGCQNCSAPLPGFWKEALDFKLFATDNTAVQNTHVPTVYLGQGRFTSKIRHPTARPPSPQVIPGSPLSHAFFYAETLQSEELTFLTK